MQTKNKLKKRLRAKLHHVKGKNKRKRLRLDFYMLYPELIEVDSNRADVSSYRLKQQRVIEVRKKRNNTRKEVDKRVLTDKFALKKIVILKKAA